MWQKTADMNKPLDIFKASDDFEKKLKVLLKILNFIFQKSALCNFDTVCKLGQT